MAVPLAIAGAGMAASAGSSYMGQRSQNKQMASIQRQRNQEAEAERIRQRVFQDQAGAEMARVLPQVTNPQTLADAMGMREAAARSATRPTGNDYKPAPQSAPAVVTNEIDRQRDKGAKRATSTATAKARLSAYGDQGAQQGVALTRAGQRISGINDASRGSAAILPLSQQAVTTNAMRGQGGFTLADALGLAGQGAQMYGFMGAPGLAPAAGAVPGAGAANWGKPGGTQPRVM